MALDSKSPLRAGATDVVAGSDRPLRDILSSPEDSGWELDQLEPGQPPFTVERQSGPLTSSPASFSDRLSWRSFSARGIPGPPGPKSSKKPSYSGAEVEFQVVEPCPFGSLVLFLDVAFAVEEEQVRVVDMCHNRDPRDPRELQA